MKIIAGVTSNSNSPKLIKDAMRVSFQIFQAKEKNERAKLIDLYNKKIKEIESILINETKSLTVSDEEVYDIIKNSIDKKNVNDYNLLAGALEKKQTNTVISALEKVIGPSTSYASEVANMIKDMGTSDYLIFWSIGEEKINEIIQAVRDKN